MQKDAWLTKIPQRVRQILHPHYTLMYTSSPSLRVSVTPAQSVIPDAVLPWCDLVDVISSAGRVRGVLIKEGFRSGDGWIPSNCRLRHFWNTSKTDVMWNALPANTRIRVIGDSNFGHIADDGYGDHPPPFVDRYALVNIVMHLMQHLRLCARCSRSPLC